MSPKKSEQERKSVGVSSNKKRTQDRTQTIDKLKFIKVLYILSKCVSIVLWKVTKIIKRYLKGQERRRERQKIEKVSLGKLIRITAPNNYSTKSQNNDCILLLSYTNK